MYTFTVTSEAYDICNGDVCFAGFTLSHAADVAEGIVCKIIHWFVELDTDLVGSRVEV